MCDSCCNLFQKLFNLSVIGVEQMDGGSIDKQIGLKEDQRGEVLIFRIRGRLDAHSSLEAEKSIFLRINQGQHKLLLDLRDVNYLSSAGMRMLFSTAKKIQALSGKLVLCCISTDLMELLRISGFDRMLELCNSEKDALLKF